MRHRFDLAIVLPVTLALAFMLIACGGDSSSASSEQPAPPGPTETPVELLRWEIEAPDDGSEGVYQSQPFVANGGPLMLYLDITKRGTAKIWGDASANAWDGCFFAFLEVPGGYWNREAAPHAAFGDVASLDPNEDKFVTQIGAYDEEGLPGAGTWILRVEIQNFDGVVRVVEMRQ